MRYFEFYSQYLEFPRGTKKEGFVECVCPFHENGSNPDAGVDLASGVFHCFKCDRKYGPAKFLADILDISYIDATTIVDEYRREHHIIEKIETFVTTRIRDPRLDKLYKESLTYSLDGITMASEYAEGRGLTLETLQRLGIGYLPASKTFWKRDSLVFPYIVDGHVVGIRYRDEHGSKGGEPKCHFTLWGIDELDSEHKIAIVVEGESDRLRTYQELVIKAGMECVVVSTPTATFRHEWSREFEGYHKVVIIPQADAPSLKMVDAAVQALKEKIVVLHLPWKRKQMGKDVCDWLNYNSGQDLKLRIETLIGDRSRRIMTGNEFADMAKEPRKYLVNKLFARRQVAIMAGPPKNFKTWLMLAMVRSVITGEEFAGIPGMNGAGDAKVLIIEEEGDEAELLDRLKLTLDGTDWKNRVFIGHHLGVRLDEESWVAQVEDIIEKNQIDFLCLDPLQRMHGGDENSATDMGPVWQNIHRLTTKFKHLGILLLHHFNKNGDINLGWNALRGSSRNAGEADLGIFVERRPKSEGPGTKVKFDGRTVPYLETPDGKDTFKFRFDKDRGLIFDTGRVIVDKRQAFLNETRDRQYWKLPEAAEFFGTSTVTIRTWIDKSPDEVTLESQGSGRPAVIKWIGEED